MRTAIALPVALLTLAAASAANAAITVKVYRQSLQDQPSRFLVRASAPVSTFALAGSTGALDATGPQSTFGPAGGQATVFRQTEVAPDRIALTRGLLSELKARTTPAQAIVVDLPADVLFDFDKATLRPDATAPLRKVANLVASYPSAPIAINGHTDSKGDDAYNDALSVRRAATVAAWVKANTGRAATSRGLGERQPVAPNAKPDGSDDPEGRQRNRRVEIVISAPKSLDR
ncbi:MAG: OmpA family protein [Alphaproteobacteria bacterium]|nr:OmpA family protein [Alphaproteobacteria bacterium]MBU1515619.1 OmpA family protein [Alphaproteobacteria bacterium]MBU2096954.1 OmpA family protein [Alphaproteobacteria bacterium]MBU2149609.1 OmpA family protein [Alphaproteobacteria bacterium]MBU2305655.1 OmpA family protein [Alphaproteobacteria bacterium]